MVFKFFKRFRKCFQMLVSSVSSVLLCMLQLLHLDISKVYWVLQMGCVWEAADGAGDVRDGVGDVWSGAGDVRDDARPLLVRSLMSPTC
jgi:hypothetical protein